MSTERYDAAVIGGGPGGYVSAIRLSQLGKRTVLIEERDLGGECANFGCVPSKLMTSYADSIHGMRRLAREGLVGCNVLPNMIKFQEKRLLVVERVRRGIEDLLKANRVKLVFGHAEVRGPDRVDVKSRGGGLRSITTSSIVIATGTEAAGLTSIPFDGRRVVWCKELLSITEIPKRLLVVGGGATGLELATAFTKLGTEVTVVEIADRVMPDLDEDLARVVYNSLRRLGVRFHLKTTVADRSYSNDSLRVTLSSGETVETEVALVSIGKRPGEWVRGLRDLGVRLDERGYVITDERMRTSVEGIYAVGDVRGPPFLANKAGLEGVIAAESIAGLETDTRDYRVPTGIFTDPEIATVGVSEREAREMRMEIKVSRLPFSAIGRSHIDGEDDGFVKIITDSGAQRVLGVQIVGPRATELINEASTIVNAKVPLECLTLVPRVHPTYGEALKEAALNVTKRAIHYSRF